MATSLLYSQPGYYLDGEKQAFLRQLLTDEALSPSAHFALLDEDGHEVFIALVRAWGELWQSRWYVLDFTVFAQGSRFRLQCAGEVSEPFSLRRDTLSAQQLDVIALRQLEAREVPGVGGWNDCGSQIRELSSMVITVHALADLLENDAVLPNQRDDILRLMRRGCDAILASQERWPDDPLRDGRFNHDVFRMTDYGTTDYHNWHDTAYAITGLMRCVSTLAQADPQRAQACLQAARLAFDNAMRRPFQLESDLDSREHPQIAYDGHFRPLIDKTCRQVYHKLEAWHMPLSLRAKEKLTFAWACALLHQQTQDARYLDACARFANAACARQCLDPSSPGYGFFYEFEGDDEAFMLEFGHNHKFFMGNIEPCNLYGLMYLVRTLPACERTIRLYADAWVKRTAQLTPLSIYPQTAYTGALAGVRFFSMAVHGFTCLYGQIAHNLLELAVFLHDEELARLAERNLLFPVGRNPGYPDAFVPQRWQCISLAKGVGHTWFGGVHSLSAIPDGSVMNGFCPRQFDGETPLEDMPDKPLGIWKAEGEKWFNEDYLPHSHGYVCGVARREQPYTLQLLLTSGRQPVEGRTWILWEDGERLDLPCGRDGRARWSTRQMYRRSTLHTEGCVREERIITLPGCRDVRHIDLAPTPVITLTQAASCPEEAVSLLLTIRLSALPACPVWLIAWNDQGTLTPLLFSAPKPADQASKE